MERRRTPQFLLLVFVLLVAGFLVTFTTVLRPDSASAPCCPNATIPTAVAGATQLVQPPTPQRLATATSLVVGGNPSIPIPIEEAPTPTLPDRGGPTTAPVPSVEELPTAPVSPVAEPIKRKAELSYPKKIEVNSPSIVRFTVFTLNDAPETEPGNETPQVPVNIPTVPGTTVKISVVLEVHGALAEDQGDAEQDLAGYNSWTWKVTTSESREISFKPHVSVRYFDKNNAQVRITAPVDATEGNLWTGQSVKIAADNVVSNALVDSMGSWINANVLGLVALVFGLPGTVVSWRELAGKRRPAPSASSAG